MASRNSGLPVDAWEGVFGGAAGLWLALALIKFGNPVILDRQVRAPASFEELLIQPWPVAWGGAILALVFVFGGKFWRWRTPAPKWLLIAPLLWLGWQLLSATQTVDGALTAATLPHFVSCLAAYYLGVFALARLTRTGPFWLGLAGGFLVVLLIGWRQHFGGLEDTRRFFYSLPDWQSYPPEFLKKVSSNRIYSTLFYPNALAGAILLLLPVSLSVVWETTSDSRRCKLALAGSIAVLGLGALFWSGSKSGWLIAVIQASVGLFRSPLRASVRAAVIAGVVLLGLGVFAVKHGDYFGRGATSAAARFDYWQAASRTLAAKPILGSGPGTFMVTYKQLKAPEAEMTRLAHNDYLQQGSDSGWIGMLAYGAWLLGGIGVLYRKTHAGFGVWVGLIGFILQSFVEFGLYVPGLAWPFFVLFGLMLGKMESQHDCTNDQSGRLARNQIDKRKTDS